MKKETIIEIVIIIILTIILGILVKLTLNEMNPANFDKMQIRQKEDVMFEEETQKETDSDGIVRMRARDQRPRRDMITNSENEEE